MKLLMAEAIREAFYYLSLWQNKTLVLGFAPIGSVKEADVEFLVEDIKLMSQLGVKITVAFGNNRQFLRIFEAAGCCCLKLHSDKDLATKAGELSASKLCLVSGVDSIKTIRHGNLDDLSVQQAESVIAEPCLSEEARLVLKLAVSACRNGVQRVHIVNAHHQGALLEELFTCHGAGVMVYAETSLYKGVRKAESRDIAAIARLVSGSHQVVGSGYRSYVASSLDEFAVFAVDDEVYGCARFSLEDDKLLVDELTTRENRFRKADILKSLLEYTLKQAVESGAKVVMMPEHSVPAIITIQPWFSSLGFVRQNREQNREGRSEKDWAKAITA